MKDKVWGFSNISYIDGTLVHSYIYTIFVYTASILSHLSEFSLTLFEGRDHLQGDIVITINVQTTNVLCHNHYAINTLISDQICRFCHAKVHIYNLMKIEQRWSISVYCLKCGNCMYNTGYFALFVWLQCLTYVQCILSVFLFCIVLRGMHYITSWRDTFHLLIDLSLVLFHGYIYICYVVYYFNYVCIYIYIFLFSVLSQNVLNLYCYFSCVVGHVFCTSILGPLMYDTLSSKFVWIL
jgi:hypothetical protein